MSEYEHLRGRALKPAETDALLNELARLDGMNEELQSLLGDFDNAADRIEDVGSRLFDRDVVQAFASAWEMAPDVDGEQLHHDLREAVGDLLKLRAEPVVARLRGD